MGDLICAQIALESIGVDPATVTWLVERRSTPWAVHARLEHIAYDISPRAVLATLASRTLVINTEQRFGLSQAVARAVTHRSGRLVSFETTRSRWAATALVPYDWDREHEVIAFARLFASAFGRPSDPVRPVRARRSGSSGTLVVALGGTHAPSRSIAAESWARYIDHWAPDERVEILAGPAESALAATLVSMLGVRANYTTRSFPEVCDTIATAREVLAIDGGLVHVASYYGVPVTALFTSGRDQKWAPIAPGSAIAARRDLSCRPCTKFGQTPRCPHSFACLDVPVEVVPAARNR
jgi:hypothetical protein